MREWFRKCRRGCEFVVARTPLFRQVYWNYAPAYYRWRIRRRIDYDAPLDPLKILWIDPDRISRFSARKNPTKNRWLDIGKIKPGDWDQRTPHAIAENPEPLKRVFTAETIEQTELFQSMEQRFLDGADWEETQIFQSIQAAVDNGTPVWGCTKSDNGSIKDRCKEIDKLYQRIKTNGYQTQFERFEALGLDPDRVGYLDVLTNEVTVDIGRDGEILFVDGRHRLCIAKILGLDEIPVVILVRHAGWMDQREQFVRSSKCPHSSTHPDLPDKDL